MAEIVNQQEVISCRKISGINNINQINASCTWTIYNFSFIPDNDNDDDVDFDSLTFSSKCGGRLTWNICISLRKDHLKTFIFIRELHSYTSVEGKISILNNKGEVAHTAPISEFEAFTTLMMKSDLYDEKKKLLVDDKLVLVCEIKAFSLVEEWNLDTSKDKDCSCEIFRNRVGIAKDYELLTDGKYSDIIFAVDQNLFHLHKGILAARSQVFSAMFQREMLEKASNRVVITDMTHEVFKLIVEFIYTGHVKDINNLPDEFLLEVLVAADKYDLAGLKDLCEYICLKRLSLANAVNMLIFTDLYNIIELQNNVIRYIVAHHKDFVNDPAFQSLSETHSHLPPQFIETRANWTNERVNDTDENPCEQHKNISMIYPTVENKYWAVSQVHVGTWSFKWTINDFKFRLSKNKWNSTSSQVFENKFKWQLHLGFDNKDSDFTTLYIQISEGNSTAEFLIKAKYEICIIDSKQEKLECIKSDIVTLTVNGEKSKMKRLKKSFLLYYAEKLLPNDTLTIKCNMTFNLDENTNFGQAKSVNGCDYKHLLALSGDFEHLLEGGQFSDITLVVGTEKFLLHQTVLALRCPCLLATISQQLLHCTDKTATLTNVESQVFKDFILFTYTGKLNKLQDFAKDLYVEAEKYELEKLRDICEAYLRNNLTVENACDTLVFAHLNKNNKLKDTVTLFIVEKIGAVVTTSGYKSLKDSRPQLLKDIVFKLQI